MRNGPKKPSQLASELCLECGLCCNGSIFSHVELDRQDCTRLGIEDTADARLDFPCEHLSGKLCTIYEKRPKICASYKCKTLRALESGEITLESAQDIIRKAAEIAREFENSIPSGITRKQAIICVASNQCPQEASDEEFLRMRLTYIALQAMVDRYMRQKGESVVRSSMRGN